MQSGYSITHKSFKDAEYQRQLLSEDYSRYVESVLVENSTPQSGSNMQPATTTAQAAATPASFQQLMRTLNGRIRDQYAQIIYKVGRNIFPLIIAIENEQDNSGICGTYILFTADGKVEYIRPVEKAYEYYKSVSHMPLGILSIIASYFNKPGDTSWIPLLQSLLIDIQNVLTNLNQSELNPESMARVRQMLDLTILYIKECLQTGNLSQEKFRLYSEEIMKAININIKDAATMQVAAVQKALLEIKERLGESWSELFVVIPTIWAVSQDNPREQIFRSLMDPKTVNTRLIIAEGIRTVEDARTLIGRIVYDRYAARTIFGTATAENRRNTMALATPIDLMGNATAAALGARVSTLGVFSSAQTTTTAITVCPYRQRLSTPHLQSRL